MSEPIFQKQEIAELAICGVHLWENCCDDVSLQSIADRNGLALWFDAAHAFSASNGADVVGSFGRAEVLSFHATKFMSSFEGGAVVTMTRNLLKPCETCGISVSGTMVM